MPVILTTPAEVDLWLMADPQKVLELQRPLPDDALRIVTKRESDAGVTELVARGVLQSVSVRVEREFPMPPPRPYWKGYLKLSLVSCPINLYAASGIPSFYD